MEKTFYISKEQFAALSATWKKTLAHSPSEHIIYNILRSKPADLGFAEKTKHIQGNNPWNAFNMALGNARWSITKRQSRNAIANETLYEEQKLAFKTRFGIDLPIDLLDKMSGLEK